MPKIFRTPVAIDKGVYAMSMADGRNAEITMYGQIVAQQPTNWWGEPIPGDYIIQSEFLQDLESLSKAKAITIRMNSLGGDAGVSILIHNRLRELAAKGASLTCIVDGVAMSGGSLMNLISVDEAYEDESGREQGYFPATAAMVTAPGCGHLMYGQITQIDYGSTEYTDHAGRRVPKFSIDQEHDMRKLRLGTRPLAAPKNYCPYIFASNVVG